MGPFNMILRADLVNRQKKKAGTFAGFLFTPLKLLFTKPRQKASAAFQKC